MGKLAFLSVRDDQGQMQIYVDKARLEQQQPEGFSQLKALLDVGDIVGARGSVKRTDKGVQRNQDDVHVLQLEGALLLHQ
jgi:lysyl-tRNA synthetase class 2